MVVAAERAPIRVVGRYALYNEIAAGGMATIHLGRLLGPVGFARTVAVKRLHPQFASDPEFVSMFLDEARLAARVQHPNVVATIDVVATDGELFLIMDYIRGESFAKILRSARKKKLLIPPRVVASVICGFLHGLHAAHEAKNERGEPLGLVHRDVSPQNVLVGADGVARVLDFGIAKAAGRIQVTRDGHIKGKLAYMPPEQLTGRSISRAADIYASAVVMWEALTGQRLFKGETEEETLSKILREPILAPSIVEMNVTDVFDELLLKALDRDPSVRHATAKDLARDIERACGSLASATEVGEWVESAVGSSLNARETEIADIESSSVGMTFSEAIEKELSESGSGSGKSKPSVRSILAAARRTNENTLPLGSLAPSVPAPGSPSDGMVKVVLTDEDGTPMAGEDASGSHSRSGATGPSRAKARSGTARKLAVAGAFIVAAVLVLVGFAFSGQPVARPRKPVSTAVTALEPPSHRLFETSSDNRPTQAEATTATTESTSAAASSTAPVPTAATPPTAVVTIRPRITPPPPVTVTAAPPPASAAPQPNPGRDCDPPYVVDATGRRKYKLECM